MAADADFDVRSGVYTDAGSTLATNGQTCQQWNAAAGGYTASQSTGGNRPTYRTSGGPNNGAYLDFDGTNDRLGLSYDTLPGAGLILCRPNTIGTFRTLFGGDTSAAVAVGSHYVGFNSSSQCLAAYCTTGDSTASGDLQVSRVGWRDAWMVLAWRYDSATKTIYLYKNGVLVGSDSTSGTLRGLRTTTLRVGGGWYNDNEVDFFIGGVARVQLWTADPGESALQSAITPVLSDHGISEITPTYLFPTFTGSQEALYMMSSTDGLTWGLRASDYTPNGSNTFRDGSMWDGGAGTYWLVHTTGSFGTSSSFAIAKSTDGGRTFSHVANVSCSSVSGANRVWAPEPVRNVDNTIYLSGGYPVITVGISTDAGSNFTFYALSPTNAGYTSWSSPTAITGTSLSNAIDLYVWKDGSTYWAWVKKDPSTISAGNIQLWKSTTSITAGWSIILATQPTSFGTSVEGPSVINLGTYLRTYFDAPGTAMYYSDADGLDPSTATWGAKAAITHPFQNSQTPRHGSIMAPVATLRRTLTLLGAG